MQQKQVYKNLVAYASAIAALTNAAIVENGLWTNNDWYDDVLKIGVANG